MMWWYLLAAIIGSSSLVILLKMFDLRGVNLYLGITINYLVGAILAFAFAPQTLTTNEIVTAEWFPISILIGALFMISFVVYAFSAQRSGVAITTISGRAAVVIPVLFAFVALGEQATALKIAMLVLILFAMALILRRERQLGEPKEKFSLNWFILLPIVVFLFNGINDTLVLFANTTKIESVNITPVFMGTMFVSGVVTGLICYLLSCLKNPHRPTGKDLLWGSILGFMNWVCMVGVFYALDEMDGSVFYPLYYTGAIVISTIVGVWVFKERLSRTNYLGIVIAVVAIAVLSFSTQ